MKDVKPKNLGQIKKRIRKLAETGKDYYDVETTLRDELIAYYSTPEGRDEIDRSPHHKLRTSEAVDLLMLDFPSEIRKDVKEYKEKKEKEKEKEKEKKDKGGDA